MKSAAKVVLALVLGALAAGPQGSSEASRVERIAALGKLWAAAKYFHPFLAYRDTDWDRALVAALPRAAVAKNSTEYAAAVQKVVEAKLKGIEIKAPETPKMKVEDLMLALKASVAAASKK